MRHAAGQHREAGDAEARSNVLARADALRMIENAKRMVQQGNEWRNPFGDGKAGESILEYLTAG